MKKKLPLCMQDKNNKTLIEEVISCIPEKQKIYLVGGVLRAARYYQMTNKKLPWRDYDLVLIGNRKKFINNLKKKGFTYGKIRRKDEITLKKAKIKNPKKISDYIVLDIQTSDETNPRKLIKKKANFTINCSILELRYLNSNNWTKEVISIKNSKKDLMNKRLRVNSYSHPANLFASIRFISKGFKPPKRREIKKLLEDSKKIKKKRFDYEINKLINYVGSERKVKRILKELKIGEEILTK